MTSTRDKTLVLPVENHRQMFIGLHVSVSHYFPTRCHVFVLVFNVNTGMTTHVTDEPMHECSDVFTGILKKTLKLFQ